MKNNTIKNRKTINREWYQSENVRPKTFHLEVERDPRGGYRLLRGEVINQINQHKQTCQRVDLRDLAADINDKGGVFAL